MRQPPALPATVTAALVGVRQRRRLLALVEGLAWATVCPATAIVAAAALGNALAPGALRPGAAWALGLASVAVVLAVVAPVWRRTSSLLHLARAVDERVPATASTLLVAVDLARGQQVGRFQDGVEAEFVERALSDAEHRAAAVHPAGILPWSSLPRRTLVGPGLLLLALITALSVPERVKPGLSALFLAAPPAGPQDPDADANIVLRNVRITLQPPAWAPGEVVVLDATTGDFEALPGTRVQWEADGPEGEPVELVWEDEPLATGRYEGGHLRVDWSVPGAGSYRVRIGRSFGRDPWLSRRFRVQALGDAAPRLEVEAPAGLDPATVDGPFKVQVRTSDDHGLGSLDQVVEANGREVIRGPIAEVLGLPTWEGTTSFAIPPEVLDAGGRVEILVVSCDAAQPPHCTTARVAEGRIATESDRRVATFRAKEEVLDRAVDLLDAVLLDDADMTGRLRRPEVLAQHERERALAVAMFEAARTLGEAVSGDGRERAAVADGLAQVVTNLLRRWQALDDHVERRLRDSRMDLLQASQLTELASLRAALIDELERGIADLGAFADAQVGERVAAEAAASEERLAKVMDLGRRTEGGAVPEEELQRAMDALREALQSLAEAMRQRTDQGVEGFRNRPPSEVGEDVLSRVERLLREGRTDEAMALLQQAQRALQELQEQARNEQAERAGSQDRNAMEAELAAALEEVRRIEAEQTRLQEQTRNLGQRNSGTDDAERQQLSQEAQALRDRLAALHQQATDPTLREQVLEHERSLVPEAAAVVEAIARSDFDGAALLARDLALGARDLAADVKGQPATAEQEDISKEGVALSGQAQALARRLEAAFRRAQRGEKIAGEQGAPLAEKQDALRDQLGALRGLVQKIGGGAYNPAEGRDQLAGAQQSMNGAGGRLRAGQPGSAQSSQEDALRQLRSFREGLEGARQSMGQEGTQGQRMAGGRGRPGAGPPRPGQGEGRNGWDRLGEWDLRGASSAEEVVMPRPEDFVGPEAWRRLVEEGVRGEKPDTYRPLHDAYYEGLVK